MSTIRGGHATSTSGHSAGPLAEELIRTITSVQPEIRDRSLRVLVRQASTRDVLDACEMLDSFRRQSENLYQRVRSSMFLHALQRYVVQQAPDLPATGFIPFEGYEDLLHRRFDHAIESFLAEQRRQGPNHALASALALGYEQITYQTLADQVRRSVRQSRGNRWMFRVGEVEEQSLQIHPRLLRRDSQEDLFPILREQTPVRMDLSHSCWSDIFFLGMDYPEGARVLNISVDLGVHGRDDEPRPPIESYLRVIAEPVLRLSSIDLNACKDVHDLEDLFNFGNDYLGLVKAAVIASGLVPPSLEGTRVSLATLLGRVVGPGHGLEIVSKVNDIPKGSRLAVSTNLLASLISLLMRATCQARCLEGGLDPEEARTVVARAILGEWLGGSGGGWQDSGGIFPGTKLIEGVAAAAQDPEHGISRGRLLPAHSLIEGGREFSTKLADSLILMHGGMAQNVGPILNMVTEKYLLRSAEEWAARQHSRRLFQEIVDCVGSADVAGLARRTTEHWDGPLKSIIPWVSNQFTETVIAQCRQALGQDFWGFLMLGGMSGGGMGLFVAPARRAQFRHQLAEILRAAKSELDDALPFAMEPVVYDFRINRLGTHASLIADAEAMMPPRYYALQVGRMSSSPGEVGPTRRADIDHFASHCEETADVLRVFRTMVNTLFPVRRSALDPTVSSWDEASESIRHENGFDPVQHEQLRDDLKRGRIGLARNRLPVDTDIRDVVDDDLTWARGPLSKEAIGLGESAIRAGEVAVVTLAAGVGSRWTSGAGVVKAVNPFVELGGKHRSFLEIHLAKTRRVMKRVGRPIPHIVTTSFLTHRAVDTHLSRTRNYGHPGPVILSRGQSIGQRLIPMVRDLVFLWEESSHQILDENKQKVLEAGRRAILDWARSRGEGGDYIDNVPIQRFHPPGHFYEVPNLLRNGVLARLLGEYPNLRWLLVHNVDTLGAELDPGVLGMAIAGEDTLAFEVIPRQIDDRGGGLARVGGRLRLLEGLAQPREETEFSLRYYNTLTTWVNLDGLLRSFGLERSDLAGQPAKVSAAVRSMAARVPTYVTIKEVKRRWGHGQEDIFPVAQFEKLWGDLTSLPDLHCGFLAVDRRRGQQLKDAAQLDGWANDGSRSHVMSLCDFSN